MADSLFGLAVHESPLAVTITPNRVHRRKRNQSAAYHRRIQKKWTKRFGKKEQPCFYKVTDPWTGQQRLIVHPLVMNKIRAMI